MTDAHVVGDPPQTAKITQAQEWVGGPVDEGLVVTLPSGNTCRVRRTFDLLDAIENETIPNPLLGLLDEMTKDNRVHPNEEEWTGEIALQFEELVNKTIVDMMIVPMVSLVPKGENPLIWRPDPETGCISIYQLSEEDKTFLYSVAQGGATTLAGFREEQASLMALVSNVPAVANKAKRPARDAKTGRPKGK